VEAPEEVAPMRIYVPGFFTLLLIVVILVILF
jgi:hypothetical protein